MHNNITRFKFSCYYLLILIQLLVCLGWMSQLAFHQTWMFLCIGPNPLTHISWNMGFFLSILISLIPLITSFLLLWQRPSLPICYIDYRDCCIIFLLTGLSLCFWCFFAVSALNFPVHTYGDESFHTSRVVLMAQDFHQWTQYFFVSGAQPPEANGTYTFYPSLAYIPITVLTMLFGDFSLIADQRISLIIYYLAIIFTTYLFARLIIKSRLISALIATIPISSALLLTYTTDFYIELPYVSVFIFSFWLLAWGIRHHSKEIVITAILVSSLAPIIRESSIAGTGGIVLAAIIWQYFNLEKEKKHFTRLLSAGWYFLVGFLPFLIYYLIKSHYTPWDSDRTSLIFIFKQNYFALFGYALLYLGPLAVFSCLFFICSPYKQAGENRYLVLAALVGIAGSIILQSVFIPGFMPWTRNYLFYYGQFIILTTLFLSHLYKAWNKSSIAILIPLLCLSIIFNICITITCFKNDNLFHESEIIFNIKPISNYIEEHWSEFIQQKIYIAWPDRFPNFPEKLLPPYVTLTKITQPIIYQFLEWPLIQPILPPNTRYVLFYYLKNESQPENFHHVSIPLVHIPTELLGYHLLINSIDPWSKGKSGIMLLEKKATPD